ncbi:hypothetical protein NG726_38150, partial [Pseudomonas sp. MOB-449]|nr:hypothetical protein [Pseudomonas sp. MOB-449]
NEWQKILINFHRYEISEHSNKEKITKHKQGRYERTRIRFTFLPTLEAENLDSKAFKILRGNGFHLEFHTQPNH